MFAFTSFGTRRLEENGPPGAIRIMKKVMTASASSVGRLFNVRETTYLNNGSYRGCIKDAKEQLTCSFALFSDRSVAADRHEPGRMRRADIVDPAGDRLAHQLAIRDGGDRCGHILIEEQLLGLG